MIDECQKSSHLFDELKDWVRINKKPGQFILTGSVRFTSKKAIRESLTGRIVYHELLPFTVSEIAHRPLPDTARSLMEAKNLESRIEVREKNVSNTSTLKSAIKDYQTDGGLPGCFSIRNRKSKKKISEQLETILDRDLRELVLTRLSYSQLLEFVEALASQEGTQISYTKLLRDTGVSITTSKKIINALESVFVIRLLKIEGGKKGWVFYFEDQAESLHLTKSNLDPYLYYTGFLYRNIRAEFEYSNETYRFFHYLTKHNTRVPFAAEWKQSTLGFLPLKNKVPTHGEIMAAQSFLKKYSNSKVAMIHPDARISKVLDRVALVPDILFF